VAAENFPAAQLVQVAVEILLAKEPTGQFKHVVKPAYENLPSLQLVQAP